MYNQSYLIVEFKFLIITFAGNIRFDKKENVGIFWRKKKHNIDKNYIVESKTVKSR